MSDIQTNPKDIKFWQDRVAKSSGSSIFLPEELHKELKEIIKIEDEAFQISLKLAEMQIKGSTRMNDLWLKVREFLAKNGKPQNWIDELGLDAVARDNGFFVVNLIEKNK